MIHLLRNLSPFHHRAVKQSRKASLGLPGFKVGWGISCWWYWRSWASSPLRCPSGVSVVWWICPKCRMLAEGGGWWWWWGRRAPHVSSPSGGSQTLWCLEKQKCGKLFQEKKHRWKEITGWSALEPGPSTLQGSTGPRVFPHPSEPPVGLRHPGRAPIISATAPGNGPWHQGGHQLGSRFAWSFLGATSSPGITHQPPPPRPFVPEKEITAYPSAVLKSCLH